MSLVGLFLCCFVGFVVVGFDLISGFVRLLKLSVFVVICDFVWVWMVCFVYCLTLLLFDGGW